MLTQEPWRATFVGRAAPRRGRVDSTLLLRRDRYVGQGMREDLTLESLAGEPAAVRVEIRQVDLGAPRIVDPEQPDVDVVAAGAPGS